nr:reverse transcriptase domain-containing protein [Tanacetum cinerariifolium]
MSTRSSARNLFPPLDNPEHTIRRRSRYDPTFLNNSEMAAEGNGDLPVPDLLTMKELCQPLLNGRQVQNSCQFHGLPGDDANKHLDKFLHVTQSIKVNGVTDDALRLYIFPHSLTYHATAWFDRLPRNSMNTFEQMAKMFLGKYFPPSMVNQQVKVVTPNCETYGGPHSFFDCPATVGNTQNVYAAGAYQGIKKTTILKGTTREETSFSRELTKIPQPQVVTTNEFTNFIKANDAIRKNIKTNMTSLTHSNLELKNMFGQFMKMNTASSLGSRTLPGNTITNPKKDLKGITTRKGTAYPGLMIPTTSSSPVVERKTEATKDTMHPANNGSTEHVQPSVVQLHDQKLRDKANDQCEKFFQIFKDLNFNISFADALILLPKFGPSIKSLSTNKDKLYELARTPLNEHCSAVLLKKLPEKLGDPSMFLIPCNFLEMAECLALADLGASINLIPLSVWNKLSLLDLSPMCMTLELADRSISCSVGVAKDVYVKVGTF